MGGLIELGWKECEWIGCLTYCELKLWTIVECEIALTFTLVQVMALCHQVTSHYLRQVMTQSHVVTCWLCVICVRKDVDSSVSVIITKACSLTQLCPSTAGEVNISCTITSNDYSSFNLTTCKISSGDFKFWSPGFEWRKWRSGRPAWLPMRRKILTAS